MDNNEMQWFADNVGGDPKRGWEVYQDGRNYYIVTNVKGLGFPDYDTVVEQAAKQAKVDEESIRSYVTPQFFDDHFQAAVQDQIQSLGVEAVGRSGGYWGLPWDSDWVVDGKINAKVKQQFKKLGRAIDSTIKDFGDAGRWVEDIVANQWYRDSRAKARVLSTLDHVAARIDRKGNKELASEIDAAASEIQAMSGATIDPHTLDQLVQMAAESAEIENHRDARATPAVKAEAKKYEAALHQAIHEWTKKHPLTGTDYVGMSPEEQADELLDAESAYLVLMTLRGEGVGIWDGDWDHFFGDKTYHKEIKDLEGFLKQKLRKFATDAGSGSLETAFQDAAFETTGADSEAAVAGHGVVANVDEFKKVYVEELQRDIPKQVEEDHKQKLSQIPTFLDSLIVRVAKWDHPAPKETNFDAIYKRLGTDAKDLKEFLSDDANVQQFKKVAHEELKKHVDTVFKSELENRRQNVPKLADKMIDAMKKGGANINSNAIKRTCNKLGIKCNIGTIKNYLNPTTPAKSSVAIVSVLDEVAAALERRDPILATQIDQVAQKMAKADEFDPSYEDFEQKPQTAKGSPIWKVLMQAMKEGQASGAAMIKENPEDAAQRIDNTEKMLSSFFSTIKNYAINMERYVDSGNVHSTQTLRSFDQIAVNVREAAYFLGELLTLKSGKKVGASARGRDYYVGPIKTKQGILNLAKKLRAAGHGDAATSIERSPQTYLARPQYVQDLITLLETGKKPDWAAR